jgi:NADH:ubiquinone oxidoreductase subunit 6 (subunit J)
MDDLVAAVIGIALMLAFASGLAWLIGAPPLVIITIIVLAMAVIDVVRTIREQAGNARS